MLMKWLRQFLRWLHHLVLNYKLRQLNREPKIVPLRQATSVALVFAAVDQEVIQQVSTFEKRLKEQGKKVDVLAYIPFYQSTPFVRFDSFTKKHVNILQIPKKRGVGAYIDKQYDLMINLSLEECLPLEYLVALSPTKYKVGRYQEHKSYCYDLMFNIDQKADTEDFIGQCEHYLNIFTHEARAIYRHWHSNDYTLY